MRILTVVLMMVCLALASCRKSQHVLVITNHSGVTAEQVAVTVCEKDYTLTDIKNGATVTRNFTVNGESGLAVGVLLSDGTMTTNGFGSVSSSSGLKYRAEIEITEDRQIVGTVK